MEKNKKIKWMIIIAAIALTGVVVAVVVFLTNPSRRLTKLLDLGNRYLEACEYEQAIAAYDEALAIDPKNVEALDKMAGSYLEWASAEAEQNGIDSALTILEEGYQKTKDRRLQEQIEEIKSVVVNAEESGTTNTSREDQETIVQESSEPYDDYRDLCEAIIAIGDTPVLGKPMKDWAYEVEAAYIRNNSTPTDTFEDGAFWGITADGNPTYISNEVANIYFGEPYSNDKEIARNYRSYEIRSFGDSSGLCLWSFVQMSRTFFSGMVSTFFHPR